MVNFFSPAIHDLVFRGGTEGLELGSKKTSKLKEQDVCLASAQRFSNLRGATRKYKFTGPLPSDSDSTYLGVG